MRKNRRTLSVLLLALAGMLSLQGCALLDDDDDYGSHGSCQSQPHFSHPYYDPCCGHHH